MGTVTLDWFTRLAWLLFRIGLMELGALLGALDSENPKLWSALELGTSVTAADSVAVGASDSTERRK